MLPRWFGPPFVPSVALGVGRRVVASVSVIPYPLLYGVPSGWKFRVPRASATVGVGSRVGARESSDGLTAAPGDGDWLLPYGVAVGVGSSAPDNVGFPRLYVVLCRSPSDATGVGSRCATSAARHFPCVPASCDGVRFVCRFSFSDARGVGNSEIVCRRFIPPSAACPIPFASDTVGVGSSCTTLGSPSSYPRPRASRALGIGRPGQEEDPLSLMGSSDLRSAYDCPFRIEPEAGQVREYGSECPQRRFTTCVSQTPRAGFQVAIGFRREEAADILDHHQSGLKGFDGAGNVQPETGPGAR